MVLLFSFSRRDHPYLSETDFHSWMATPCSSANQLTNCFQTFALEPSVAEISSAVGFSALPINAFGISTLLLSARWRRAGEEIAVLIALDDDGRRRVLHARVYPVSRAEHILGFLRNPQCSDRISEFQPSGCGEPA